MPCSFSKTYWLLMTEDVRKRKKRESSCCCLLSEGQANLRSLQHLCNHTASQYCGQHEFGHYDAPRVIIYADLDVDSYGYGYGYSYSHSNGDRNVHPTSLCSHPIARDIYYLRSDALAGHFDGLCSDAISSDHNSGFVSIQIAHVAESGLSTAEIQGSEHGLEYLLTIYSRTTTVVQVVTTTQTATSYPATPAPVTSTVYAGTPSPVTTTQVS